MALVDTTSNSDSNGSSTTERSMFGTLEQCIPKGCGSVLESTIHDRSARATVCLKLDGGVVETLTLAETWTFIDRMKPSKHAALVIDDIDDIDDEWCGALCDRYPESVNRKFPLEHILGLESKDLGPPIYEHPMDEPMDEPMDDLKRTIWANSASLKKALPCLEDGPKSVSANHIDCWYEQGATKRGSYPFASYELSRSGSGLDKDRPFPVSLSAARELL
jgi:hypothetical protein